MTGFKGYLLPKIVFGIVSCFLLTSCAEGKAKDDFVDNFDLNLKGEVLNIEQNQYGQYLVCLKVIKSNHKNYFPVHNPNKYRSENSDLWEDRFFIKVQDSLAIMILINDGASKIIHNRITKGSKININSDGKKGYEIYDGDTNKSQGKIYYIMTSPVRDNIKKSCLNRNNAQEIKVSETFGV